MIPSQGHVTQPDWSQVLAGACKRYSLNVKTELFEDRALLTFTNNHIVAFSITDAGAGDDELMSFRTRTRGFLKFLADGLSRMAQENRLDIGIASQNGQVRQAQINRRVRPATDEEREKLNLTFIIENEPLDAEQLWNEYCDSLVNRPGRVLISFAHRF